MADDPEEDKVILKILEGMPHRHQPQPQPVQNPGSILKKKKDVGDEDYGNNNKSTDALASDDPMKSKCKTMTTNIQSCPAAPTTRIGDTNVALYVGRLTKEEDPSCLKTDIAVGFEEALLPTTESPHNSDLEVDAELGGQTRARGSGENGRRRPQQARPGAYACAPRSTTTGGTGSFPTITANGAATIDNEASTIESNSNSDVMISEVGGGTTQPRPTTTTTTIIGQSGESDGVGGLATANPVEELPFAQAQQEQSDKSNGRRKNMNQKIICCGTGVVAVLIVIVVLALLNNNGNQQPQAKDKDQNPTGDFSPTTSPSMAPSRQGTILLDLLPDDTVEAITFNMESPQAKAFDWLMDDPNWTTYSNQRLVQRFALATLYISTSGGIRSTTTTNHSESSWFHNNNWLSYKHECDWWSRSEIHKEPWDAVHYDPQSVGNACGSYEEGMYEHIWLWENQLEGSLPEELYLLTSLRTIDIVNNGELIGTLSTRIGHLNNLEALGLYHNALTGSMPTQIGLLSNLKVLGLYGNQLSSVIPTQFGVLKDLQYLMLDGNLLTGPTPSELGHLQQLVTLFLDTNHLTSQIPTEVGKMKALQEYATDENQLTGPIPSQLGGLEKLWMLHLADNMLTSTIPSHIGDLSNLNALVLRYNKLTGSIPTTLGSLESVWSIDLLSNELTGLIPSQFGFLSTYRGEEPSDTHGTQYQYRNWIIPSELHLNSNNLSGEIPSELGLLTAINVVSLQDNQLTGEIPTQLGDLRALTAPFVFPGQQPRPGLSIRGNTKITGQIPTELGSITGIIGMDLSNCSLTGEIPSELAQLSSATQLSLANNRLTGTVPPELGALALNASLLVLDLSGNELSGMVPPGLCLLEERGEASLLAFDCSPLCGCQCKCNVGTVEEKKPLN